MTLLLPATPPGWPTARAAQRWATITAASLHTTWRKANPREHTAVEAYWQGLGPRPTVQTAYGRHLVEHCDDLRELA